MIIGFRYVLIHLSAHVSLQYVSGSIGKSDPSQNKWENSDVSNESNRMNLAFAQDPIDRGPGHLMIQHKQLFSFQNSWITVTFNPKVRTNRLLMLIWYIIWTFVLYFSMGSVYCLEYVNTWYTGFTFLDNLCLGVLKYWRNKV